MEITRLYVKNFRNIKEQEFSFHPGMNIFCGNNAQGKTNLCEAIALCMGPSFKNGKQTNIIPFDNENAVCEIVMNFKTAHLSENTISFIMQGGKREIKYNNIPVKSAMELYGILKYVVFIPDHLNLIKGKPELRRDYLDSVAMMQTLVHLKKLSEYNKALKNKNIILSDVDYKSDIEYIKGQIESWNSVLANEGLNVTYGRLKYFEILEKVSKKLYSELSGGEELIPEYYSSVFDRRDLKASDISSLRDKYLEKINSDFDKELKMRYAVSGVHRDDVYFYINGMDAREFGSQGQQRSIALVLKLAEAEIIRLREETPIMILDDVLSELDSKRRQFILNHIVNSQLFITCCNIDDLKELNKGKVWNVANGEFTER